MPHHLIRLALACCVSAFLAACTTAPTSPVLTTPSPSADQARPSAVSRPLRLSQNPEAAGTPSESTPGISLADEVPQPGLLNGEVPREFQRGHASWYGPGFNGRRTASGERYDMHALTAAHRTLPFGTLVRVRSLVNGREVDVRITDRGPYSRGRIIDVSRAAAEELGMLGLGFKQVVLLVPESTPDVEELPPAPKPVRRVVRKPAPRKGR
ncbi:MAG: septal ring lytic transglycosylase RlpA family protein [Pseudomonadota bacterium]